jgi:putative transposase
VSVKFAFIDAEKARYSIVKMCAWMDVSTSGFYEWRDRPTSATARRRARLATLIEWIFNDSDHTYGHRRSMPPCTARASASPRNWSARSCASWA